MSRIMLALILTGVGIRVLQCYQMGLSEVAPVYLFLGLIGVAVNIQNVKPSEDEHE